MKYYSNSCKFIFINIFTNLSCYKINCYCKKDPKNQQEHIQSEITKHQKYKESKNYFFSPNNSNNIDNNDDNDKYSLCDLVNERKRFYYKIDNTSNTDVLSNILNEIKTSILDEKIKSEIEGYCKNKRNNLEEKEKQISEITDKKKIKVNDIEKLISNSNLGNITKIIELIEKERGNLNNSSYDKLIEKAKAKGKDCENVEIRDFLSKIVNFKKSDIEEKIKEVEDYKYIDEDIKIKFKSRLEKMKKEKEEQEDKKIVDNEKTKKLLAPIIDIRDKFYKYRNEYEKKIEEKLLNISDIKDYINEINKFEAAINKIDIEGCDNLKNIKENSIQEFKDEKIQAAEFYIQKCTTSKELEELNIYQFDKTNTNNFKLKIKHKEAELLQKYKNEYNVKFNYCSAQKNFEKVKDNKILLTLNKYKISDFSKNLELKNIENLNILRIYENLLKIGNTSIVDEFDVQKFEFNKGILIEPANNSKYEGQLNNIKKNIIDYLKNRYKENKVDSSKNECFKFVIFDKSTGDYYSGSDYFKSYIDYSYLDHININSDYKIIATVKIDNKCEYVIYCNKALIIKNSKFKKEGIGIYIPDEPTKLDFTNKNFESKKIDFVIAYVKEDEDNNS